MILEVSSYESSRIKIQISRKDQSSNKGQKFKGRLIPLSDVVFGDIAGETKVKKINRRRKGGIRRGIGGRTIDAETEDKKINRRGIGGLRRGIRGMTIDAETKGL